MSVCITCDIILNIHLQYKHDDYEENDDARGYIIMA